MSKTYNVPVIPGADARTLESMARWIACTGGALGSQDIAAAFGMPPALVEEIMADDAFAGMVAAQAESVLRRDGTRAAVSLLVHVVRDVDANLGHRMRAAELILTRTVAPAGTAEAGDDKSRDLNEMSTAELRRMVDQMEGQLAERAEPVESSAVADVSEAEVIEGGSAATDAAADAFD